MTDPMPQEIPLTNAVQVAVIASIVSNFMYGRGIGDVSCKYTLSFSPSSPAFGMWFPIYTGAIVSTVTQIVAYDFDHAIFAKGWTLFLYSLAWGMAALWTPVFAQNTGRFLIAASVLLCLTSACATLATAIENPWSDVGNSTATADSWPNGGKEAKRWLVGMPISLLAGWTLVAATLSVGIAWKANDGIPDEPCESPRVREGYSIRDPLPDPKYGAHVSYVPLFLSFAVGLLAFAIVDPIYPLPVAWAVSWMRPSVPNRWAFGVLVASSFSILGMVYYF